MAFFRLIILLIVVGSCSPAKKITTSIQQQEQAFQYHIGLHVFDPTSQKEVIKWQDNMYMNPASNTKILTLFATIAGKVDSLPGITYQIKNDTLYFGGTGDPTLLHMDLPQSRVLSFLINSPYTLAYIGETLKDERYGPGWAWDDYNDYYQAEKSALPLYGNIVRLKGDAVSKLRVTPSFWNSALVYNPNIRGIKRAQFENTFYYAQSPLPAGLEQDIPVRVSDATTLQLLNNALQREVTLAHPSVLTQPRFLKSMKADTVLKKMMYDSDNMIAEQLLLVYAHQNQLPLTTKAAIQHVTKNHLPMVRDTLIWKDGSGLSRYNLFTPRSLVEVLHQLYKKLPEEQLLQYFPMGGTTGTLQYMFRNQPAFVYAKTGSFSNNFALSGYLRTKSGKLFIFSIMNNNYIQPTRDIRKHVEELLIRIHENY